MVGCKQRIGIMGGTFDPIHNAHLMLGRCALEQLNLDEIWFMPDRTPPHKRSRPVTAALHRCRMTALGVGGEPGFVCSLFEQQRSGFTYTADTLEALHQSYPEYAFYFMIGADSLFEIESWHTPARVMAQTTLLVAKRSYPEGSRSLEAQADYLQEKYGANIVLMNCPAMEISSTDIRERVRRGISITGLVPIAVEEYIRQHELYRL